MSVFNQSQEIEITICVLIAFAAFLLIFLPGLLLMKYFNGRKSEFKIAQKFSTFKRCSTVNIIKISPDEKREKRSSYIHCPSPTYVKEDHFDLENPNINPAFTFSFD